jgi:hypothetical protein
MASCCIDLVFLIGNKFEADALPARVSLFPAAAATAAGTVIAAAAAATASAATAVILV